MTEPVKVMAPMATPSDISTRLAAWMAPTAPMPKASRRIERGGGHQHRGQADQRVEGGDQLRHRGHRRCARAMYGADAAADGEAADDQRPAAETGRAAKRRAS